MRLLRIFLLMLLGIQMVQSQVSITPTGTPPDPSSMLDVAGSNRGVLIPRLQQSQRDAIPLPANALLIYQTNNNPGFYYNQGTPLAPVWVSIASVIDLASFQDRIPIDSLPYNISAPGSYYVTAHLTGPVGINIMTSNVTIDLNGYTLKGTSGNASEGIEVTLAATNITIRNGSVATWGKEGIKAVLATNSNFSNLQILSNAYDGLAAGNNNLLSYTVAGNNGFDGIDVGESCALLHCTAANNQNDGMEADGGSSILQCTARDNMQAGIRTTGAATITECASSQNDSHGFSCGAGSMIRQNTASNNGQDGFYLFSGTSASENTARNNGNHGFEWLNDCQLLGNNASLNSFSGFSTTYFGGKVDGNSSNANSVYGYNIQNSGGCLIIRNTASGNGVNAFNVLPGNTFATAVTPATINTNTNPFANFQL